jgi:C-terminal processing protease CtpA/Prc
MPYIYTQPIIVYNVEFWASKDNTEYYKQLSMKKDLEEQDRKFFESLSDSLLKYPNKFVSMTSTDTFMIRYDTVYSYPKNVAIIIDKYNASSSEEFLLSAKQSKKVILFGKESTMGALDYSNLYPEYLPSGKRGVLIPTSRSFRLKEKPIDNIGIYPDVILKTQKEKKTIRFIIEYLRRNS